MSDVVVDIFKAKKSLQLEETAWEPPPIQKAIATAEERRRQLDTGSVNQADLARRLGLTRARVTQVLRVLTLHPAILDFLRKLPAGPRARLYTERRIRPLLSLERSEQLDHASIRLSGFPPRKTGQRTG